MEKTLAYLREILSSYVGEHQFPDSIYKKLQTKEYNGEGDFVRDLNEEEISYLNQILPDEIQHAMQVQDFKRVYELNEVYELL
jgi:hypothetical protein